METPQVVIARRNGRVRVTVDLDDDVTSIDALWHAAVALRDEAAAREADLDASTTQLEQQLGGNGMTNDLSTPRYSIHECPDCDGRGYHVVGGQRRTCDVCLGDRYVFDGARPTDATHYINHSAHMHRCDRCTPQQEVA